MSVFSDSWQLALELHRRGELPRAAELCHERLRVNPRDADALHLLGVISHQRGNPSAAIDWIARAILVAVNRPVFHNNLGEVYHSLGRMDEARACYQQALRLDPRIAAAHYHLGLVLRAQQDRPAAIDQLRQAVSLDPSHVEALVALGDLEFHDGQFQQALASYERAITLRADWAGLHWRRGLCYHRLRMVEPALAGYLEALRLDPREVDAHNHLAGLYLDMGRPDPAIEHVQQALTILPKCAELHGNLALMLRAQGRFDESMAASRRAIELAPHDPALHSNLLYTLNDHDQLDAATVFAEHLAWAARHAEPLTAQSPTPVRDRQPARRVRIGYVSPYFRQHAVNYFCEPILASHDHESFDVYCYSDVKAPDAVTARLRSRADTWRDVLGRSDAEVSELVRADRIDILIDLTGHIAGNRLQAFARRPAPVQVTYLGYQNTTGMSAMNYRLTDDWADPAGQSDAYYTEQLVRLPRAFFCYQPCDDCPPNCPLPAAERGYVTFGSFNNFNKVTPKAISAWLEILDRVADSRLIVLAFRGGWVEDRIGDMAQKRGIEPARIELVDKCSTREYYDLVQRADIALDSFPFNGHTTTCDAIWMGVPVVMIAGDRYASRFGGSVLRNVGMTDMITRSVDEYIETAVSLARDTSRLVELRATLRQRMHDSPLCDFVGFTRDLEQAYRRMWRSWCTETTSRSIS